MRVNLPDACTSAVGLRRWTLVSAFLEVLRETTTIMIKCGRNPKTMYRRQYPQYMNKELLQNMAQEATIERGYKIARLVEKLSAAIEQDKENEKRRIEDKIRVRLSQLSLEERRKWWNTEKLEDIQREIEGQISDSDAYGEWLENTIIQATAELLRRKNESIHAKILQGNYADNPAKTMSNVIWKQEKPECNIEMERMRQTIIESTTPRDTLAD